MAEVVGLRSSPVVPEVIHGFTVIVGVGAYPKGSRSHRRAMYAELRPCTKRTTARMKARRDDAIVGCIPLTVEGAREILADPGGRMAELSALDALRAASRLARKVNE